MKRLMIATALALALVSGFQIASSGAAQAGERQYRSSGEWFGRSGHYYGDRHSYQGKHKKQRHVDRRSDRRHYGFVKRYHTPRPYGYYAPYRKWHYGQNYWRQWSWRAAPHWTHRYRYYGYGH